MSKRKHKRENIALENLYKTIERIIQRQAD